jgi:hypothetical protein
VTGATGQLKGPWTLSLLLACVLLGQLAWLGAAAPRGLKRVPITVGESLPFDVQGWAEVSTLAGPLGGPCRIAFVCSPKCPACSDLAFEYVEAPRATEPLRNPIWLVLADSTSAQEWARERRLPASEVLALSPLQRRPFQRPLAGQVWVTPMRLILRADLTVQDARPVDGMLTAAALDSLCRFGGIAAGSLNAYRELQGG